MSRAKDIGDTMRGHQKGLRAYRLKMVLDALESFDKIENKATDEVGWIALKFSCSPAEASKLIKDARAWEPTLRHTKGGKS